MAEDCDETPGKALWPNGAEVGGNRSTPELVNEGAKSDSAIGGSRKQSDAVSDGGGSRRQERRASGWKTWPSKPVHRTINGDRDCRAGDLIVMDRQAWTQYRKEESERGRVQNCNRYRRDDMRTHDQ